jgi:hypothetical protein
MLVRDHGDKGPQAVCEPGAKSGAGDNRPEDVEEKLPRARMWLAWAACEAPAAAPQRPSRQRWPFLRTLLRDGRACVQCEIDRGTHS